MDTQLFRRLMSEVGSPQRSTLDGDRPATGGPVLLVAVTNWRGTRAEPAMCTSIRKHTKHRPATMGDLTQRYGLWMRTGRPWRWRRWRLAAPAVLARKRDEAVALLQTTMAGRGRDGGFPDSMAGPRGSIPLQVSVHRDTRTRRKVGRQSVRPKRFLARRAKTGAGGAQGRTATTKYGQ